MKFRLLFEGEIQPRRRAELQDIHSIRRQFHPQLKKLWDHEPLVNLKANWLVERPDDTKDVIHARIESIGGRKFAPIISKHLAAELDIVLLRQQARGQLIGEGGLFCA